MFTLKPLPTRPRQQAHREAGARAETATIGHFRNWGFMDPMIRAMQPDVRIAGPAVTVRPTASTAPSSATRRPGARGECWCRSLRRSSPRRVRRLVAYACKVAGLAGVIIDGVAPTSARCASTRCRCGAAACPRVTTNASVSPAILRRVSCGGVNVNQATSSSPTNAAWWCSIAAKPRPRPIALFQCRTPSRVTRAARCRRESFLTFQGRRKRSKKLWRSKKT